MATTAVTLNGVTYFVPQPGEQGPTYDQDLTNYLVALATAFPQGGSSPSSTFQALVSATANPATAGSIRLAKTDLIDWRNQGNTGNDVLGVNSNDDLTWTNATTSVVSTLSGQPGLVATMAVSQTGITAAANVKFDTVTIDTDTAYSTGTGNFTVPAGKAGFYLVCVSLITQQVTTPGTQTLVIAQNGTRRAETQTITTVAAGAFLGLSVATIVNATAGQTLSAQLSTTAGTVSAVADTATTLSIKRLV